MNANDRKIIYVCSPLRGNIAANIGWAKFFTEAVLRMGHTPVTPHVFYAEYLDDEKPREREQGMGAGISLLRRSDEVWIFGNRISEGMAAEIREAQNLDIPVRRANLYSLPLSRQNNKRSCLPIRIELMEV